MEERMADVKKQFEAAAAAVKKAGKDPGNDLKLKLYAHFKQATEGDVQGDKPGFTDFVNRAKYEAWAKLKGMGADEAMKGYVKLVDRVTRE
jgi:acyl-CoA-binding protein